MRKGKRYTIEELRRIGDLPPVTGKVKSPRAQAIRRRLELLQKVQSIADLDKLKKVQDTTLLGKEKKEKKRKRQGPLY
jgi:hypothetical protein